MKKLITVLVYIALIVGIFLGKLLTNYREGMTWKDVTLPTSVDIIVAFISSLGFVLYFETRGTKSEGSQAAKQKNWFRRILFAFQAGFSNGAAAGWAI